MNMSIWVYFQSLECPFGIVLAETVYFILSIFVELYCININECNYIAPHYSGSLFVVFAVCKGSVGQIPLELVDTQKESIKCNL